MYNNVGKGRKKITEGEYLVLIGEAVKAARVQRGMSRKALAAAIGVSPTQIYRIESGRSGANVETLQKIAQTLGVPVSSLLDEGTTATANIDSKATETPESDSPAWLGSAWLYVGKKATEYSFGPQDVLEAIELLRLLRERSHIL